MLIRRPGTALPITFLALAAGCAWALTTALPHAVASDPAPVSASRTLRIHQSKDFITLDWTKSAHAINQPILANLHEGLVRLDSSGAVAPGVAESWKVSDAGRKYLFQLRRGVKWSDGKPLLAEHFVKGWKRALSPLTAAPYSWLFFDVKGAREFHEGRLSEFSRVGVRALTPETLEVELEQANPDFLMMLSAPVSWPVREDLISKHGNVWTKPGNLVGLGPYVLKSHEHGRKVILGANPYFRGGNRKGKVAESASRPDTLEFVISSPEDAKRAFLKGGLDLLFKPSAEVIPLRYDSSALGEVKWAKPIRTKRLSLNLSNYPLTDVRVRQAIAHALDRKALAASMGRGFHKGATLVPPGVAGYEPGGGTQYSPKAAKRSLYKALGKDADVELSLLVPVFDESRFENQKTATFIQKSLKNLLGINVKINEVAEYAQWSILAKSGSAHMILHDWEADYPGAYNFYATYSSVSTNLNSRWDNPTYNTLIQKAKTAPEGQSRQALFRKADALLTQEHVVMIPLYYRSEAAVVGKRVKNYTFGPYLDAYRLGEVRLGPN